MLTKTDKWRLFLSSYLPLYILIIVKDYQFFWNMFCKMNAIFDKSQANIVKFDIYHWSFFIGVIALLTVAIITIFWFILVPSNQRYEIIGEFEKSGDSVISYIVTYVIPLLSMDIDDPNSVLINLLLFIFIGVLYVAQDLVYLNPILALLGYSFYMNGKNIVLTKFSTEKLKELQENGIRIKGNRLGADIYIYREIVAVKKPPTK
ncbi:hypothetical protein SAMN04487821_11052 [Enterococcus malodoratus]|uniref:hypothetical protein n=1 Tax=Enterococcus malodoratus TaxID=71451 RepID=UPI0008BBC3D6|nr:hypothetical protein [Enterococcus malodoratus]SET34045.1 hypothetical protein SAMN04487821_11052 [Enterococcus malodoratus]